MSLADIKIEDYVNWDQIVYSGSKIIMIIIFTFIGIILTKIVARSIRRMMLKKKYKNDEEKMRRADTLSGVFQSFVKFIIYMTAIMMILRELGLDISPLIATAGLGAVAIGFGAQSLIKDFFAGFFLLMENQLRLGDWVAVGVIQGEVQRVNLRTTVLRDVEGKVHTIPNGEIKVVSNLTKDYSKCTIDFGVAYKENVDEVMKVLKEVMDELASDFNFHEFILDAPKVFGVQDFADSAVMIRTQMKTKAGKQWEVGRELRRRVKNRFDELDIEIPFPHQTLYLGKDFVLPIETVQTKTE